MSLFSSAKEGGGCGASFLPCRSFSLRKEHSLEEYLEGFDSSSRAGTVGTGSLLLPLPAPAVALTIAAASSCTDFMLRGY
jgi:hypothetical protein